MTTITETQSIKISTAARQHDCHPATIRRLISEGKIDGWKIQGGHWRVSQESLERYFGGAGK